jgi:hypothetical protein
MNRRQCNLRRPYALVPLILLPLLSTSGCFVRKRVVPGPAAHANRPLITATKEDLIQRLHAVYDPIQSFTLRVDIAPSVGSPYGGELTDYATIRGILLFSRPDSIRIVGLDPVVHTATIFDMASVGREFRVSIPSKNRFIEGDNEAPANSANKLENLRPSAFLTSMLIEPPDPKVDLTMLEDDTDENKAVYNLHLIHQEKGELRLVRNIFFDRYTLNVVSQKTFIGDGKVVGEAKYADWKVYDTIAFPTTITIRRPVDGYEVVLTVVEMHMNPGNVTPDRFVLAQPPGSQLQKLK